MVQAAQSIFETMAIEQTIRPIVEECQRKVLERINPFEYRSGKPITDIKKAWLMDDDDFVKYIELCNKEYAKKNVHATKPEFCPLLEIENLKMQAEHLLIEEMEPITHINIDQATNNMEHYHELVNLTLRLLAPFVKNHFKS